MREGHDVWCNSYMDHAVCTTSRIESKSRFQDSCTVALHKACCRVCSTDCCCETHLLKGLWQRLGPQGGLCSLQLGFDIPLPKQPLGKVSLQVCGVSRCRHHSVIVAADVATNTVEGGHWPLGDIQHLGGRAHMEGTGSCLWERP